MCGKGWSMDGNGGLGGDIDMLLGGVELVWGL